MADFHSFPPKGDPSAAFRERLLAPTSDEVQEDSMTTPTEFFHWYIVDEGTGNLERTAFKLTRKQANRAFPGSEPDASSRELRDVSDPREAPPDSRPGEKWAN